LTLRQVFQRYYRVTCARKKHKWTDDQSIELYHYVKTREELGGVISMSEISKSHYRNLFPDTQLRHHYDYHCKKNKDLVSRYKRITEKQLNAIIQKNSKERENWDLPAVADEPKRAKKKSTSPKRKLEHIEPEVEREPVVVTQSRYQACTVTSTQATVLTEPDHSCNTIIYNKTFEPFKKRFKMASTSTVRV